MRAPVSAQPRPAVQAAQLPVAPQISVPPPPPAAPLPKQKKRRRILIPLDDSRPDDFERRFRHLDGLCARLATAAPELAAPADDDGVSAGWSDSDDSDEEPCAPTTLTAAGGEPTAMRATDVRACSAPGAAPMPSEPRPTPQAVATPMANGTEAPLPLQGTAGRGPICGAAGRDEAQPVSDGGAAASASGACAVPPAARARRRELCKFYLDGCCQRGDACEFRHEGQPARRQEPCKFFLLGLCRQGSGCVFSHDPSSCRVDPVGLLGAPAALLQLPAGPGESGQEDSRHDGAAGALDGAVDGAAFFDGGGGGSWEPTAFPDD